MNLHPFTAPEYYDYKRLHANEGYEVVVAEKDGVGLAFENVRQLTTPFLPDRWKPVLHDIRMRRAEVKAARQADLSKVWGDVWLMTSNKS